MSERAKQRESTSPDTQKTGVYEAVAVATVWIVLAVTYVLNQQKTPDNQLKDDPTNVIAPTEPVSIPEDQFTVQQ